MRPKEGITYQELMTLVPTDLLQKVAIDTKVNASVSKLTGEKMFSLLLYGLTSGKEISLRILEDLFNSPLFQPLAAHQSIRHSSIGARLNTMNPDFFKQIFEQLTNDARVARWVGAAAKKYAIKKHDSTMVSLSSKLLTAGMRINEGRTDLKFTVAIAGGLPIDIELFTEQTFASEDKALPTVMRRNRAKTNDKTTILIFDRGVRKRDTFDEINQMPNTFFVTRWSGQGYRVDRVHSQVKGRLAGTFILESDEEIHFESTKEKRSTPYRLVTAVDPSTKQKFYFLTNILFLNAVEICELYKSRWEIETFFKFLKQQLNFSHLVSRSENGIKVMMYLTMITALLIAVYKKVNRITGWVIAKRRLVRELEAYVITRYPEALISIRSMAGLSHDSSLRLESS